MNREISGRANSRYPEVFFAADPDLAHAEAKIKIQKGKYERKGGNVKIFDDKSYLKNIKVITLSMAWKFRNLKIVL